MTDVPQTCLNDGILRRPDGKPFSFALSKEHPSENRAHGFNDDLLVPFSLHFDSVCYQNLYPSGKDYGIVEPCPNVPLFANCNVLFAASQDPNHESYALYREFVHWWTDAIGRSILTAGLQKGIFFNLCGYTKERIEVIRERYERMIQDENHLRHFHYSMCQKYQTSPQDNDLEDESVSSRFAHVPHLAFNVAWTAEEKQRMNAIEDDLYPGFTDWDLAFILRNEQLVRNTTFYCVSSPADLPKEDTLKPLSLDVLREEYKIIKE